MLPSSPTAPAAASWTAAEFAASITTASTSRCAARWISRAPPQGYPVLVQAGSSEDGREFAGRFAEAIYTAQNNLADAQAFYTDVKARMRRHGRTPDQLCILPGVLRTGAAGTAAARVVSNRVHRPHPARPFRAAASRR
jgi:alkanesulfonate monooxygenase SsuD/methylene tetrahydromethanopterin reductase-like flavin-dependent oxidoreductase (luciferase family)